MKPLLGPWRITFDTNPDICNIHCRMCEEHSRFRKDKNTKNRMMDFSIIKNVIESAAKHGLKEIIPSTMGEPLLYPHMEDIIKLVRMYKLKLNLTTNGSFPNYGAEKWGNMLLPFISDMKISINGSTKRTDEYIMEGINFENHITNIKKIIVIRNQLIKDNINKPGVTFQITYMESNIDELPDLLKLAIDLDADRFKGHHMWITWPELEEESLTRNIESRKKWNKIVNRMLNIADQYRLKNGNRIKLDNVYPIPLFELDSRLLDDWICPFLGREAWIAWNGTFNVCCSPDILRQTFGYYGNVEETDFISLWNSDEYKKFVLNWENFDVCKNCNMRRPIERGR